MDAWVVRWQSGVVSSTILQNVWKHCAPAERCSSYHISSEYGWSRMTVIMDVTTHCTIEDNNNNNNKYNNNKHANK